MTRNRVTAALTRFALPLLTLLGGLPSFAATDFSVIQFNTFGVPFASKDRWRYAEAMKQISDLSPDFVVLEEVFTAKGKKKLKNDGLYPYRVDGPRAFPRLISSGLRILSKYPIQRAAKLTYSGCRNDDCLSHKGALLAVIQLPDGGKLTLVATHLNARGEDSVRESQIAQLRTFIEYYREPGAPLLLSGDFNFDPESPVYPKLISTLNLRDAWSATHDASEPGYTSDCETNAYAREYFERYHFPFVRERIDLLLTQGLSALSSQLIFNEGTLLSDHFGLLARFSVDSPAPAAAPVSIEPEKLRDLEVEVASGPADDSGVDDEAPAQPELEALDLRAIH